MVSQIENARVEVFDKYEQRLKDFKWALGINQLSLRLIGVWPEVDDKFQGLLVPYRAPFMITAMFFSLLLPQMLALKLVMGNLPLVIDNLLTSSAVFTSSIKIIVIWRNKQDSHIRLSPKKALRPVIHSITQDWLRPKLSWQRQVMLREASKARLFTAGTYVIMGGCYVGFAYAPLFGFNIRMTSNITDYSGHHLFVQSDFPYDYSKSPNYELTHGSQLITGFFLGMSISIPDNYFSALVFHASAQFEILGINMKNYVDKELENLRKSSTSEFSRMMGTFVDRQVHLIRIVTVIEYSFHFVVLCQIACLSIMGCCLAFEILSVFGGKTESQTSLWQILTLTFTLFTHMMHVLVDCFAAETLAIRSTGIFHDIYNSSWYDLQHQRSRDLLMIMTAAKNPQSLTAGKICTLSLRTYCSILKSMAGYISMLLAVNNRQHV